MAKNFLVRFISGIMIIILPTVIFSACRKNEDIDIIGEWYNAEDDDYLIIQSDNTYKMKHHSGAGYDMLSDHGTWRWLNDEKIIKFIDASGKSYEVPLEERDGKTVIKYSYFGYFEKGGSGVNNENEAEKNEEDIILNPDNLRKTFSRPSLHIGYEFSDNKIWLQYDNYYEYNGELYYDKKNDESYVVCVDNNGKVLLQFNSDDISVLSQFSNGVAHINYKDVYSIIDENGKVLSAYPKDKFGEAKACGDGYTLMSKYYADFNTTYYTYTIYDSVGKKIDEFKSTEFGELEKAVYCGKGIFGIVGEKSGLYIVNQKRFAETSENVLCMFDGEFAFAGVKKEQTNQLVFLKPDGEYMYIPVGEEMNLQCNKVYFKNSACVIFGTADGKNVLASYDLKDRKLYVADDYYVSKINWGKTSVNNPSNIFASNLVDLVFNADVFAVPVVGVDGENYAVIFNKKMETVSDPIKCSDFTQYYDNRMMLIVDNAAYLYDENGNEVLELSKIGSSRISWGFSEGLAVTDNDKCIDLKGNVVFELNDVDFSSAKNMS